MTNLLKVLLLLVFSVATYSWSQEEPSATPSVDEAGTTDADSADSSSTAGDAENDDLDEQVYEEDDDDFVPTEEIPVDEPIPFPSNI